MRSDVLTTVLARYPPIARPLGTPELLGNAGGHSGAQLWRFASGRGPLVARAWPEAGMEPERLRRIHADLLRARGLGFIPVPEPDSHGETVQYAEGRLWEVDPWLPGAADLSRPPHPARLAAGFAGLAALHDVLSWDRTTGPSASLRIRASELHGLIHGGFEDMQAAVLRAPNDPSSEPALRWLGLARTLAPRFTHRVAAAASRSWNLQVCLRDVRPDHFLFEGERLTGVVDFGSMGFDRVEGDLARLLGEWVGDDRRARGDGLAAYSAVRRLDDASTSLIATFEIANALLGASHWIRWHFVDGRVFDDALAVGRGIERGIERLAGLAAGSSG